MLEESLSYLDSIVTKEELWSYFGKLESEYESQIPTNTKRLNGIYFTHNVLAQHMIVELIDKLDKSKIASYTFFEPCVGLGAFVFAYLYQLSNLDLPKEQYIQILKNIYAADVNEASIKIYKILFKKFAKVLFGIDINKEKIAINTGSCLIFDLNSNDIRYIGIAELFPRIIGQGGFDIVITNPPYKNLKAERNKYSSIVEFEKDKNTFKQISDFTRHHYKYINSGTLNIYKLFVEEILCNYSKKDAFISLLIPSAILTDKSCEKIREFILNNHNLSNINIVKEGAGFVNAQQSLTSLLITKNAKTDKIKINNSFNGRNHDNYTIVSKSDLSLDATGYSIFALKSTEYQVLKKLREFPTIKSLDFVINMRGELDLTLNKDCIVEKKTKYRMLRGRDLSYYAIEKNTPKEFVKESFIATTSKSKYINMERIAGQQIANISKKRRLTFSLIPSSTVLANSCNFMLVKENKYKLDIYALLGIMNSKIMNWMFKITSSNNHINNYEIDMLPIPIESKNIVLISTMVKEYLKEKNIDLLTQIDKVVDKSFNIFENEKEDMGKTFETITNRLVIDLEKLDKCLKVDEKLSQEVIFQKLTSEVLLNSLNLTKGSFIEEVAENIIKKYIKIYSNQLLNHTTFKLSDLDLEMVKSVPQGGNWKNIPQQTILKSRRLQRITQTGGRTTLYGRIDYEKPSYTITTYFNRPGNGTYIHPIHNRVLSAREAARFQCFPDDYYFVGNKTNILKQIGNAVPTMLAFSIGRNLAKYLDCKKSIDLFCGAGGLTVGLHEAGITSLVGLDNDEKACVTLKVNNPGMEVICDDITKQEVKQQLYNSVNIKEVDLVCGGPPCQGFSLAGKRFIDDPRNKLFRDFVEIVKKINPKVMLLENVPGMLTLSKGLIYNQILELFSSMGYDVEGRLLLASNYCAPQRRKRLIIIGIRKDLQIKPDKIFPSIASETNPVNAKEAIGDLENVECTEDAQIEQNVYTSDYVKMLQREISFEDFYSKRSSTTFEYCENEEIVFKNAGIQLTFA